MGCCLLWNVGTAVGDGAAPRPEVPLPSRESALCYLCLAQGAQATWAPANSRRAISGSGLGPGGAQTSPVLRRAAVGARVASAAWSWRARLPLLTQLQELSTGFCSAKNFDQLWSRNTVYKDTSSSKNTRTARNSKYTKYSFLHAVPEAALRRSQRTAGAGARKTQLTVTNTGEGVEVRQSRGRRRAKAS